MAEQSEKITDATKEAERRDAAAVAGAPQVPTAEEAEAADRKGGADPAAAKAYEEYLDDAKDQKGEGRIP
ncbi:MAG TPA: hypothetical protein VM262_00570 [Acidimicrobiales bacterium]|nr:hypothetical protein [Acidimicrobiales bacterium]